MIYSFNLLPNQNPLLSDEDVACSEAIQSEIEHYLEMLINGVDFTDEKAIDLLNAVQSGVKQSSNFEKVYRKFVTSAVSVIMYSPYATVKQLKNWVHLKISMKFKVVAKQLL